MNRTESSNGNGIIIRANDNFEFESLMYFYIFVQKKKIIVRDVIILRNIRSRV